MQDSLLALTVTEEMIISYYCEKRYFSSAPSNPDASSTLIDIEPTSALAITFPNS